MRAGMLALVLFTVPLFAQTVTVRPAVQLQWVSVAGASRYNVYRDGVSLNRDVAIEDLAFTDLTVSPGSVYRYTIIPIVNGHESFPLPVVTVGVPVPALPPLASDVGYRLKPNGVVTSVLFTKRKTDVSKVLRCDGPKSMTTEVLK